MIGDMIVWAGLMAGLDWAIRVARAAEVSVIPGPVDIACPWCGAGLAVYEGQVAVCECGARIQAVEPDEVV